MEASHIYHLDGHNQYLTVVEAQGDVGRRYFKAYLAERLNGEWRPLATEKQKAFASMANVTQRQGKSYGEIPWRLGLLE